MVKKKTSVLKRKYTKKSVQLNEPMPPETPKLPVDEVLEFISTNLKDYHYGSAVDLICAASREKDRLSEIKYLEKAIRYLLRKQEQLTS